ncbi:phosphatidylserine decarboxylase family protein [candidate division KSB1 bacterium]|nr:phosphatidylserine decarboxylase family protein [candidate division KSB1 bacterium]
MHREGYAALFAFLVCAIIFTYGVWIGGGVIVQILTGIFWFLVLFTIYFFRDPERTSQAPENNIISPADGKVIELFETEESDFFKTRVKKVGIFMSPADVHVNRAPIAGQVTYFRYQKGRFLRANLADAATENEQTIIGLEDGQRKLLFKQIAGFVARRVCCDLREGHKIVRGERIGMIKFGSRVDLYLPMDVELKVQLNERVRAGESIIGEFHL